MIGKVNSAIVDLCNADIQEYVLFIYKKYNWMVNICATHDISDPSVALLTKRLEPYHDMVDQIARKNAIGYFDSDKQNAHLLEVRNLCDRIYKDENNQFHELVMWAESRFL